MKGFFSLKETQSASRPDGKTYSCASCGRYQKADSPRMKPYGLGKKNILIVGDFPTGIDDQRNKIWQGKAGRHLSYTLNKLGIDLFEDCISINAVNCHTINEPSNYEIDCCRTVIVNKVIKEHQPKLILVLGDYALFSTIGNRWKKELGSVDKWRGFIIPDRDYKCWLCPTFDPEFVMNADKLVQVIWEGDLRTAIANLEKHIPKIHEPIIHILEDLSPLDDIENMNIVAFDYETTGLKPQAERHRIVCASIAISENVAYAFMMPTDKKGKQPFLRFLANEKISKMAHNMKFEETWSAVRLKQPVQGWFWDSMIAAHIMDNRPGITGLKFQTYVNFGVVDYSSEVTPYLQSATKDGNALNNIMELTKTKSGIAMLLKYCAMDSIFEYRLAMIQRQEIMNNLPF